MSLDASKAFDKVLHAGLFIKLLNRGASVTLVKLLKYWYSHLQCAVLLKYVLGDTFNVTCGVKQGGVLSPYLFSVYMDELICKLRASGFGLYIGNVCVGCVMYADDIMLLSGSCFGAQKLVDACSAYGQRWNICFNSMKTQCLTFGGKNPQQFKIILNNKLI